MHQYVNISIYQHIDMSTHHHVNISRCPYYIYVNTSICHYIHIAIYSDPEVILLRYDLTAVPAPLLPLRATCQQCGQWNCKCGVDGRRPSELAACGGRPLAACSTSWLAASYSSPHAPSSMLPRPSPTPSPSTSSCCTCSVSHFWCSSLSSTTGKGP